ncbi:Hypothetical predicted protein [Mytilus galloprovincialis]|uniref:Uncharacterized protein n=2 Tax=Mytilus galloprovincialis TaxID=29158 RepID=A0A8B6CBN6_MYTGA|nr:Hypothetical predicted protein [Mytilus galloprovincialis]
MSVYVAAIDFGTTYSGYAFSVSHLKTKLPEVQILSNQAWNAGIRESVSLKTPTCLLLTKEKEILSFGYEAENRYTDIVMDGEEDEYYYFYRFKMNLHENQSISMGMLIEDVRGQTLPAVEVFSLSIQALKDHMAQTLLVKNITLDDDTNWILTVPAIWSDTAKLFMRKGAEMAGIAEDKLTLALEPEAASIYCQTYPPPGSLDIVNTDCQYLVVDLGGGTVDITAHEKLPDGTLKELSKASGNNCGGTSVDKEFIQMMADIFGQQVIDKLKQESPDSYLSLIRCFENVKRTITPNKSGLVNVSIPNIVLDNFCKSEYLKSIEEVVASCPITSSIQLKNDKLRIEVKFTKSLFKPTINSISSLIKTVLDENEAKNISHILLVGGFAECALIQEAVKSAFSDRYVIVPEEAGLAVLKGAVLFRYQLNAISSRVTRCTYGVEIIRSFNSLTDEFRRRVYKDGIPHCENIFHTFMPANRSIPIGMKIRQTFTTSNAYQYAHRLPIFYTHQDNVQFTDDGTCVKLGIVEVEIPNPTKHLREVTIIFHFGETELNITAIDKESGKDCETSFTIYDFI